MPNVPSREIRNLLFLIDTAFNHQSWHGTNLRGSIRGVSAEEAAWRPGPRRHNIWEIVVHAAYWKYAVWRRLTGNPRGSFPLKGSNWFHRSDTSDNRAWRADVRLLDQMHRALRESVSNLSPAALARAHKTGGITNEHVVMGIAAHDLYHAGQIQLLKRLHSDAVTAVK